LTEEVKRVRGLYFEGRKDRTLLQKKGMFTNTMEEEHICLVEEPETTYLGHVAPASGAAEDITSSILKFCDEENVEKSELEVLGCDGAPVNTGRKEGIMRRIEKKLNKPLQHVVCMMHFNELSLRHLMRHLDGRTKDLKTTSGPIGWALIDCEKRRVTCYRSIPVEWIHQLKDIDDLSTDQQYLLDISRAVSEGTCSPLWLVRSLGPLCSPGGSQPQVGFCDIT